MNQFEFDKELIGHMLLSVCETMQHLPFSNQFWLENYMVNTGEYIIKAHKDEIIPASNTPIDACRAYLEFMVKYGLLHAEDFQLLSDGEDLIYNVKFATCAYQGYCKRSKEKNVMFNCARLATLQAALRYFLGKTYTSSVRMNQDGICYGRLTIATRQQKEVVTREEHILRFAGRRSILLTKEIYASLLNSIKVHAPHTLKHVLYDTGYRSGLQNATEAREYFGNIEECLRYLLNVMENNGMGKLELLSFDPSSARVKLRCYDSYEVDIADQFGGLYRAPQVICDLLRGTFAAYLTVLFEQEMICEELLCKSMGEKYCEFVAMPYPKDLLGKGGAL